MSNPLTRRHFLQAVGVAGGAGVLHATMGALGLVPTAAAQGAPFQPPSRADFTLTGRSPARVVVLGGGVAGLAVAHELGKAGYRCQVLEARERPGGRNLTLRGGDRLTELDGWTQRAPFADGTYFNAGPARIAQWMVTMEYCRELGVPLEVFANANANAYVYNERAGMTAPVRHRTARADVYGYVSELLAKAVDQGALDARLTAEDRERLLEFCRDFGALGGRVDGDPEASWRYTGGPRRGYRGDPGAAGEPGVVLSPPPPLSEVFAHAMGRYFSFELGYDQAMLMFQPVGGMDRIVTALADAVGRDRIRCGAEVTRITELPDGVEVAYRGTDGRERTVTADHCVAALPPHLLARIPNNLGEEVRAALARIRPAPAGKIGLEYRSRWWETDHDIYGGITETDLDLAHVWYPSHGFHGRRGLVVGYYNTGAAAEAYGRLSPTERERRAVDQGVRIHGEKYRTELAGSLSIAWHRVPHLEGAWTSLPGGLESTWYAPLTRPTGRVHFAGDWLSHMVAWQSGAFASARRTVTELHRRVMSS